MNQKALIALNTAASYSRQGVRMLIQFFLVPFILRHVGSEQYGIYVNVLAITGMLTLLEFGVSGAVERYIAHEGALKNDRGCREVWMTSLTAYLLPFGVTLLLGFALAPWVTHFIKLDSAGFQRTAEILLILATLGVAFSFPTHAYRGVLRGDQREVWIASTDIVAELLRAAGVVLALSFWTADIAVVLAIFTTAAVLGYAALAVLVHWRYPWARFDRSAIRRERLMAILGFSIGSFMAQVGTLLSLYLNRLIVGKLMGPTSVALYYVVGVFVRDQIENIVMQFTVSMQPAAARVFAVNDTDALRRLFLHGSRYVVVLAGLLMAPIAAFANPLLRAWLPDNPEYAELAPLMAAVLGATMIEMTRGASHGILFGTGRVHFLGAVNLASVVLEAGIAIVLLKTTPWGLYNFAIAAAASALIRRPVITWYVCKFVQVPIREFLVRCVLWPIIPGLLTYGVGVALVRHMHPAGWISVLGWGGLTGLVGLAFSYFVTFDAEERDQFSHILTTLAAKVGLRRANA